nr:hypothetical protein [Tanacetum cinerariifolium]
LPKLKFQKDHLCSACAIGKSTKKTHKPKSKNTNQEKLYLLHMDLCRPMRVESVNGKKGCGNRMFYSKSIHYSSLPWKDSVRAYARHFVQPINTTIPVANCSGKRSNRKACFVCKSVVHLLKDFNFHTKKMAQPTQRNYAHRGHRKQYAPLTYTTPQKHMIPTAMLTQSKPIFTTAVRPVSAALPNIKLTRPSYSHKVVTKSKSPIKRYISRSLSSKISNLPPIVTAVHAPMVSAAQGNMSCLFDFEELNGGYVAFGGNRKGGKITSKGKIKTGKLDFDDVYFVKKLKFNLFSVSQMCDKNNSVLFTDTKSPVLSPDFKLPDESQVLLRVPRENNMYNAGPYKFQNYYKLVKGNLVRGLPTKVFENDNTCVACKKGKQHRASCKTKPISSVDQPLFRLYKDLLGPTFVKSLNKKSYCLVITDDYSRFTRVFFLATKDETSPILKTFITGLENQLSLKVKQNGIAERKNMTLIEVARTMLADLRLPIPFWAEAVNTACYVHNRVLMTKPHNKTPYELLHGRTPSIGFMRPIGYHVTILNTLDPLGKFQRKVDEGFLVGYSVCCKAFRIFNSRTRIIQETLHVNFLENKPNISGNGPSWLFDIDSLTKTMNYQPVAVGNQTNSNAGFQDKFNAEKAGEEVDQQYVLFPMWSSGFTSPQNNDEDATFDGKEHDFDVKKRESKVIPSSTKFKDCSNNSSNEVNVAGSIVPTVRQNSLNSTNTFSVVGPSNTALSPTYGKSSFLDASQLPDDPDMLELEDITYSDDEDVVGTEADFNNLESSIPEEPKRVHQALKDPSWIEAM